MAILPFNANQTQNQNTRPFANQAGNADQPAAKVWLNTGYIVRDASAPEGEQDTFISLPFGMPIDTMKATPIRGQNTDWIAQQNARNELLEHLQRLGASLQPGETRTLNLTVQLRRVNEEVVVPVKDNKYAVDLSGLAIAAE